MSLSPCVLLMLHINGLPTGSVDYSVVPDATEDNVLRLIWPACQGNYPFWDAVCMHLPEDHPNTLDISWQIRESGGVHKEESLDWLESYLRIVLAESIGKTQYAHHFKTYIKQLKLTQQYKSILSYRTAIVRGTVPMHDGLWERLCSQVFGNTIAIHILSTLPVTPPTRTIGLPSPTKEKDNEEAVQVLFFTRQLFVVVDETMEYKYIRMQVLDSQGRSPPPITNQCTLVYPYTASDATSK